MTKLFIDDYSAYPSYRKPLYDVSGRPIVGTSYRRNVAVPPSPLFGQGGGNADCLSYAYDYASGIYPQGAKTLTWYEVDGTVSRNNTTTGSRANQIQDTASYTKEENEKFSSPGDAFSRAESFLSEMEEMWASFRRTPQELISQNQFYISDNNFQPAYNAKQDSVFSLYAASRVYNRLTGSYSSSASNRAVAYVGYMSQITGCIVVFPMCRPGAKIKVSATLAIYNNSYCLTAGGPKYSVEVPSFNLIFRLIDLAGSWDNAFSPPYSDFSSFSETSFAIPKTVSDGLNTTVDEASGNLVFTVPKARWGLLVTDMSEFEAWAKTAFLPSIQEYLSGTETRGTKNRGGSAEVSIQLKFNGSASTGIGIPVAP